MLRFVHPDQVLKQALPLQPIDFEDLVKSLCTEVKETLRKRCAFWVELPLRKIMLHLNYAAIKIMVLKLMVPC